MFVNVFVPHIPAFACWKGPTRTAISFNVRAGNFLQNRRQGV